jgi:geranylgeranyl diphosphate synthase, type I
MQDTLSAVLARYAALVDTQMRHVLAAYTEPHGFYGMMRYHLGWVDERLEPVAAARGKGLRAALLLLVNGALGGDEATALPLAAAVELLHNFSLVHDDVEDRGALRHHRPTLWALWGAPLSINAGDGLFALAHLALLDSPLCRAAPDRFIGILRQFEETTLRLCEGQHLDMTFESLDDVSVDEYLHMIAAKTAALIAAAGWIGARAANATQQQVQAAHDFGRELGLAFQMQDDILGIWGDEALTGKSAASDIAARKKTLPVLLAMTCADRARRDRLRTLYAQRNGDDAGPQAIMAALDGTRARDRTDEYLRRYWDAAMAALERIGLPPEAQERLRAFARLFVDRSA